MTFSPLTKTVLLFFVILGIILSTFTLALSASGGTGDRVQFRLTSHTGETLSQNDLGGRHLMVFFGFSSCREVCPTQMSKLSRVMTELDRTGHGGRIQPVFISVDPERDTPDKLAAYLKYFDERFIGLTGSRPALKEAADSFKTLLESQKANSGRDYQVTHSSLTYVVDPFSRIIDYSPGDEDYRTLADKIRELI